MLWKKKYSLLPVASSSVHGYYQRFPVPLLLRVRLLHSVRQEQWQHLVHIVIRDKFTQHRCHRCSRCPDESNEQNPIPCIFDQESLFSKYCRHCNCFCKSKEESKNDRCFFYLISIIFHRTVLHLMNFWETDA